MKVKKNTKENSTIYTSIINPIDYYNTNCIQEAFNMMIDIPNVEKTSINSFAYVENRADMSARMIVLENNNFVAKMDNGLKMPINIKHTPFMMLQKFKFKDNFYMAMHNVMHEYMNIPNEYIRVGTRYYKLIYKVDRYKIKRTEMKVWDKIIINDDYGKKFLNDTEKYDDFTIEPNNKDYHSVINNNYNLYSKFEHKSASKYIGDIGWHWSKTLLKHIFNEQYELGLKYIKVLYDNPKQVLPILVLISEERMTGKTTFVDWLSILFGANMVVINPQDIASQFNGSYADKNIIAIEESRFDGIQTTEKLKNLATQKKILVNSKHVQQYSIPFYGKLIITSNDEDKFSKVDNPEIRYWVRKIPTLKGKANHQILDDLVDEIPQFLKYIENMDEIDFTKSRMVFEAEDIITDALITVKAASLPALHKDIDILLDDHCMSNIEIAEIKFTAIHIKNMWFKHNNKIDISYITKILKNSMKLERGLMQRFKPLQQNANIGTSVSGRPFIYKNKYYKQNNINYESSI